MELKPTNPKDSVGVRKAPITTIPLNVVLEVGVAMLEGARKYGRHNYRTFGAAASVYIDAAFRHIAAWWEGESIDPDSGLSHLTKAIASLVVLRDSEMTEKMVDDRPPSISWSVNQTNSLASAVIDQYPNLEPCHVRSSD